MKWVKQTVGYWCPDIITNKYLGQGVRAAVLDTGITLHPDFDRRIIGFRDFVNHKDKIYDDGKHGGKHRPTDTKYGNIHKSIFLVVS